MLERWPGFGLFVGCFVSSIGAVLPGAVFSSPVWLVLFWFGTGKYEMLERHIVRLF